MSLRDINIKTITKSKGANPKFKIIVALGGELAGGGGGDMCLKKGHSEFLKMLTDDVLLL